MSNSPMIFIPDGDRGTKVFVNDIVVYKPSVDTKI